MKKLAILLGSIILMSGCTTNLMSGISIGPGGITPNISIGVSQSHTKKVKAKEKPAETKTRVKRKRVSIEE